MYVVYQAVMLGQKILLRYPFVDEVRNNYVENNIANEVENDDAHNHLPAGSFNHGLKTLLFINSTVFFD